MRFDQSHRCPYEEIMHPLLSNMRPEKNLIRLRDFANAHARRDIFWRGGSYVWDGTKIGQ